MAEIRNLVSIDLPVEEFSPRGTDAPNATEQDPFDIQGYLTEERSKDLLRFSTAGSVDDGKSTLIGRLLYDTQSVYDDQIRSIEGKGTTAPGVLDLALLTDGLRAEREQGITIDVAYRYFSTPRRKFIIADTPGHEQYTRNMATGASTADVAIVLIDARKGVLIQSRRHAYITALLGVRQIILAVNKMDLVDYSESVFQRICSDFEHFFRDLNLEGQDSVHLHFVPVSALKGDNVVHRTETMPWYAGPSLLGLLESLPTSHMDDAAAHLRFAVQRVIRPNLDFRGFAGQIAAGTVRPGDRVTVLPSGKSSRVARVVTFDGDLEKATAPLSVTLTLEDEIDISRGDLLVASDAPAQVTSSFTASLVWMDEMPLDLTRRYLLKHTSRTVQAHVRTLLRIADLSEASLRQRVAAGETLAMNGIGEVRIEVLQPIAADAYAANRTTGSFVLLDSQSNATVAAGMIRVAADAVNPGVRHLHDAPIRGQGPVTPEERLARFGHRGAHIRLEGSLHFAQALERVLFEAGASVLLVSADAPFFADVAVEQGLLVLTYSESDGHIRAQIEGTAFSLERPADDEIERSVRAVLELLTQAEILLLGDRS